VDGDGADSGTASVTSLFLTFFSRGLLAAIVQTVNHSLPAGDAPVTRNEILKWIGILLAMVLVGKAGSRRWYWSETDDGVKAAPRFGSRFGMGRRRWEIILKYLGCVHEDVADKTDPWWRLRPWVTRYNSVRATVVNASWLLCGDESFSSWLVFPAATQGSCPARLRQ